MILVCWTPCIILMMESVWNYTKLSETLQTRNQPVGLAVHQRHITRQTVQKHQLSDTEQDGLSKNNNNSATHNKTD